MRTRHELGGNRGPAEGQDDAGARLDPRRLRALFQDLLERPPLQAERERWRDGAAPELVDHLLGTPECWETWLADQLYYFLLVDNFRPSSERVLSIPEDLGKGRLGVRDALHRIALCASFDRRNPGADTFVTVVLEQFLGRTVQDDRRTLEIGKTLYDGRTGVFLGERGDSQADVVRIVLEQRGALEHFLRREHLRLLRARPERRDLAGWVRALEEDPLAYPTVLRAWFASDAYAARLARRVSEPNRLFVRSLFVDLADRLPAPDEEERMRNALDGLADAAPLRAILARLLLDSGTARLPARADIGDPGAWVAGLFERWMGRAPTAGETSAFTAALADPACRPETVAYALVSHPEYATY